jgi:membrane associated rhomboid family serine protease
MIPIRDQIPTHRTPVVNYLLIAVNIIVFVLMWLAGSNQESLFYQFALIPESVTTGLDAGDIADVFTSMFMHGGWAHLIGNMLYLWIFGDNVEDSMGPVKYLLFYLVGGIVASAAHILTNPGSEIPTVGASGAIAAVLGAYLILYPQSRVMTLIPLGYYMRMTSVPAIVVLGLWFILQIFSGVMSLGGPDDVGGVAFWAHVGGFVAGLVLAKLLAGTRRPETAVRF